jgi:hypothetical protein
MRQRGDARVVAELVALVLACVVAATTLRLSQAGSRAWIVRRMQHP